MIISISGLISTGKTTLANELKRKKQFAGFKKIIVSAETERIANNLILEKYGFLQQGKANIDNIFNNKQMYLEHRLLQMKLTKESFEHAKQLDNKDTLIILDRGILDSFIYSVIFSLPLQLTIEDFYKIIKELDVSSQKPDIMFYTQLPANDKYESDGVRSEGFDKKEFRESENIMSDLMFGGRGTLLPEGLENRLNFIESEIKKLKHNF